MRTLITTLLLLAVLVPARVAAAPRTVTNPMTANLDAAGFNILNVGYFTSQANIETSAWVNASTVVASGGTLILEPPNTPILYVTGGSYDPSVVGLFANVGSLFLRSPSGVYQKTGGGNTDWTRIGP